MAVLVGVIGRPGPVGYALNRGRAGEGDRTEVLLVKGLDDQEVRVTVPVSERGWSRERAAEQMDRAAEKIGAVMLGENVSLQEVRENLHLPRHIGEVSVNWYTDQGEWISSDGQISPETEGIRRRIPEKGVQAVLRADMRLGEYIREYTYHLRIFPPRRTQAQRLREDFAVAVREADERDIREEQLRLPKELGGRALHYRRAGQRDWLLFPVLGVMAAALLPLSEKQKRQKEEKRRERQMMQDYPDIISRLVIFLGAGLPVRRAWEMVVQRYEQEKTGNRAAYDCMASALYRMRRGMPEREALELFSAECRLIPYRRLAGLLEQNVRNGSSGMRHALESEMSDAFLHRKELARVMGEEASTKLLLPLLMMLLVVMVMVSVPAFLSFGI